MAKLLRFEEGSCDLHICSSFHLLLSSVRGASAAAARCLISPLPLPAGPLAGKYSYASKGNDCFCCIYRLCFSLSPPKPSNALVHTKTLSEMQ